MSRERRAILGFSLTLLIFSLNSHVCVAHRTCIGYTTSISGICARRRFSLAQVFHRGDVSGRRTAERQDWLAPTQARRPGCDESWRCKDANGGGRAGANDETIVDRKCRGSLDLHNGRDAQPGTKKLTS